MCSRRLTSSNFAMSRSTFTVAMTNFSAQPLQLVAVKTKDKRRRNYLHHGALNDMKTTEVANATSVASANENAITQSFQIS